MAEMDLTGLLGIETPQARSKRLLEEGAALSAAVQSGSPAAVAAANLPTAAASMRGSVGRLFGVDTRTPSEKLQEQLAGTDLSSSAGLSKAAQLARSMGMNAQAVALATQAGLVRQEEEDRSLRRKREQQIIDLAAKEDERADTTEERQQRAEARANATLAINQAALLREISQSEAQRTAAQDAFVKEFPEDVELAQAIGTGALTLNEARLWKQKGDPADWPQFVKWAEENPDKGYDEFLQFMADLKNTTSSRGGISLNTEDIERLEKEAERLYNFGIQGPFERGAPTTIDKTRLIEQARVIMENQPSGQQITAETALRLAANMLGGTVEQSSTSISPEARAELEGYGN